MGRIEIFVEFLANNNCLSQFKYNFLLYIKKKPFLKEHPSIYNNLISDSFIWKYTPEGYTFWMVLDNKWRGYYQTIGNPNDPYYKEDLILALEDIEWDSIWED